MPEPLQSASGPRTRSTAVRVGVLAERNWGVVSRREVRGLGMSDGAIARAVARRALVRLYPGVYAVGHRVLRVEGRLRAALLYAGPGAVLSHTTAGWWWRMIAAAPRVIHLSAPVKRRPVPGLRLHHPRRLEMVTHRGFAVTPPRRTLRDMAALLPFDDLRRALAEAEYLRLVDAEHVLRGLGRGRTGSAALRRACEAHLPELALAASALEERFLALIDEHGIEAPEVNVRVGPFKVDALWRADRVVVELDGHRAHANPVATERDRERDLELRRMGFVVLRYTWRQVTDRPERVLADLDAALRGRRPAPEPL